MRRAANIEELAKAGFGDAGAGLCGRGLGPTRSQDAAIRAGKPPIAGNRVVAQAADPASRQTVIREIDDPAPGIAGC